MRHAEFIPAGCNVHAAFGRGSRLAPRTVLRHVLPGFVGREADREVQADCTDTLAALLTGSELGDDGFAVLQQAHALGVLEWHGERQNRVDRVTETANARCLVHDYRETMN